MRSWNLNLEEKLTDNFTLKEFIHWADNTSMSDADKLLANKYAQGNFRYEHYVMYKMMSHFLEEVRLGVHVDHLRTGHDYALIITSGYRPEVWEKYRGRSGGSQHTICAVDFVVYNKTLGQLDYEATLDVFEDYKDDFNGGIAVKYTEDKKGAIFCHIDFGRRARWEY